MASRFAMLAIEGDSDDERPKVAAPKPAAQANGAADKAPRKPRGDAGSRAPAARKTFTEDPIGGPVSVPEEASRDDRGAAGRGRGAGRGQRNARGGRGRGDGARGGRLDRHSATGIHDSEKKEHQGWGGDDAKRELEDENEGKADATAEVSGWDKAVDGEASTAAVGADGAPVAAKKSKPAVEAAPEPEPEVDNSKTYDEYMIEKKAAEKVNLPTLAGPRKANEGADDSQWKDGVAFTKKDGVDEETFYTGKGESKSRTRKAKEGKTFLDVDINYGSPTSGGGERGGRGRGRGGPRGRGEVRGRGSDFRGGRGARGGPSRGRGGASGGVDIADASAFPTLG